MRPWFRAGGAWWSTNVVKTAELTTSGGKVGKMDGEIREEDELGGNDVKTTVGEAMTPGMKPGTPPGGRSPIIA
jgi:hypothetical protein